MPVEMTAAEYKRIHRDYRGYSATGSPQMLTERGIVDVVLTDKPMPAAPVVPAVAAPTTCLAPVCLPTMQPVTPAVPAPAPVPASNYQQLLTERRQVADAWNTYDFAAVKPATARRVRRRFESEYFHLDVACQAASGRPVVEHGGYSGRNTKCR